MSNIRDILTPAINIPLPTESDRKDIIADFTKYAKFMLGDSFTFKKLHYTMCDELNKSLTLFKEKKRSRKGFFTAPRHGKTLFFADLLLTYMFGRFPDARCFYGTYNELTAARRKSTIEAMLASDEYKWLFPKARTRDTIDSLNEIDKSVRKTQKNTVLEITNVSSRTGALHFAGRGTSTTGIGYDVMIVDDPYKDDQEARSEKVNQTVLDWFEKVVQTRLEPGNMMFLIYTRWVSKDIAGLLKGYEEVNADPNYVPLEMFVLPAEMVGEKKWYDDREPGEPLDTDRLPEYAQAKKNPELWAALYQQEPLDVFGALMKLDWFPRYHNRAGMNYITIVVDTNYREATKTVDKTAIAVYGTKFGRRHLIEFTAKKMDFPEQLAVTEYYARKYPYWAIVIETKANGDALLSSMRKKFSRCVGVDPQGRGKRERAQLILPALEAGMMSLPDVSVCPNVGEFVQQLMRFTGIGVEEDDLIDTMIYDIAYYEQFAGFQGAEVVHVGVDRTAKRMLARHSQTIAGVTNSTRNRTSMRLGGMR